MEQEQVVKKHCVKKLAQILFECVDCPSDRTTMDWLTAEKFINENPSVVRRIIDSSVISLLSARKLVISYEEFDEFYGRFIWESCYQVIQSNLPRPPYGKIRFY